MPDDISEFRASARRLNRVCGIYAWIHRASGMCYVGSALDIGRRIAGHLRDARGTKSTTLHHRAIRAFGADAFDVELLEECAASGLPSREAFYIAFLDAASVNGFNTHTKPGHGARGSNLNEATKQRLSEIAKGRKFSPLAIQRSLEARRTPEGRAANAAAKKGHVKSTEAIEKHRAKMLGRKVSEETRRKISEANKGVKPSQSSIDASVRILKALPKGELEKRLSDGFKGMTHTEESKAKIGAGNRGKKQTPEQVEANRQRALARWKAAPRRAWTAEEKAAIAERTRQQHARKRAALMACEI